MQKSFKLQQAQKSERNISKADVWGMGGCAPILNNSAWQSEVGGGYGGNGVRMARLAAKSGKYG